MNEAQAAPEEAAEMKMTQSYEWSPGYPWRGYRAEDDSASSGPPSSTS